MTDILAGIIGGVIGLVGGSLLWWFVLAPILDRLNKSKEIEKP